MLWVCVKFSCNFGIMLKEIRRQMQPPAVRELNVHSFVWGGKQIMVMSYGAGNYLNIIITSNAELVSKSAPVYSKSLTSHFTGTRVGSIACPESTRPDFLKQLKQLTTIIYRWTVLYSLTAKKVLHWQGICFGVVGVWKNNISMKKRTAYYTKYIKNICTGNIKLKTTAISINCRDKTFYYHFC